MRTDCVCCLLKSIIFCCVVSQFVARILQARSAAFLAPESPIASVPTGTPPGICAMESSESIPESALLLTGTPSTGSVVCEATIPGRWAAPPAPAMMTFKPRVTADFAYSFIKSGVRCAETTLHSCGMSNCLRIAAACCMVGQSD